MYHKEQAMWQNSCWEEEAIEAVMVFLMKLLALLLGIFPAATSCPFLSPDSSLRSAPVVGKSIEILFNNLGEAALQVFWVDQSYQEIDMGTIEVGSGLGYFTNEGMAWRIKLQETNLVVLEYKIEIPLPEPFILNSDAMPMITLSVGAGCSNEDKSGTITSEVKDPLKLFIDDDVHYPTRTRTDVAKNIAFDEVVEVEVDSEQSTLESSDSKPEDGDCTATTDDWLNKYMGAEGYHVICISNIVHQPTVAQLGLSYKMQAWKEGYTYVPNNELFSASNFSEFRRNIEILLDIRRTDLWRVSAVEAIRRNGIAVDGSTKWAYLPQKWRLFDEYRRPVDSLDSVGENKLLLLFEGGQFVFPGVDINFKRLIQYEDRTYVLKTLSMRPLLFQIDNLLNHNECDDLVSYARSRMTPSDVSLMDKDKGKKATEFRTSEYAFVASRSYQPLIRIDNRIANITGISVDNQEDAQILKYEVGNYYFSHTDYWSPMYYQSKEMVAKTHAGHKNRMATVFWYMSNNVSGGCTSFTNAPIHNEYASQSLSNRFQHGENLAADSDINGKVRDVTICDYPLRVSPKKGRAIIFYSLLPSGNGDAYSQHAACAVTGGTKWAANKWIWNQFSTV